MTEMNGIYVFNVGNHYHFYTGAEEYIGTVVFPDKQISKLAERNTLNLEAVFTEKFHFGRLVPPKVAQSTISKENRGLRVARENVLFMVFVKLLKIATFHG